MLLICVPKFAAHLTIVVKSRLPPYGQLNLYFWMGNGFLKLIVVLLERKLSVHPYIPKAVGET
jgi:hypothetical protein